MILGNLVMLVRITRRLIECENLSVYGRPTDYMYAYRYSVCLPQEIHLGKLEMSTKFTSVLRGIQPTHRIFICQNNTCI